MVWWFQLHLQKFDTTGATSHNALAPILKEHQETLFMPIGIGTNKKFLFKFVRTVYDRFHFNSQLRLNIFNAFTACIMITELILAERIIIHCCMVMGTMFNASRT